MDRTSGVAHDCRSCYTEKAMVRILYENDEILVIDKPAGLASQPGEAVGAHVVQVLEAQLGMAPYLVHRLDRDTAGCMVLARNPAAASRWSRLIAGREVRKRYLAWVAGAPSRSSGTIDLPLEGSRGMQEACTLYRLRETCMLSDATLPSDFRCSLLELELRTGRMHQIRRHLASLGLPIIADDRHGDFQLNRVLRKLLSAKRLLLRRQLHVVRDHALHKLFEPDPRLPPKP
ncbi:MAG: RNA pseudouridine synthase, partial [Rectinemataceae bacterium]